MIDQKVIAVKGTNAYSSTKKALKKLKLNIEDLKDKRILIKPNAGRITEPNTGINTNPDVVAGVIDFLIEEGIKNLFIGESSILGVNSLKALEKCGISAVAKKRRIPLVDLDAESPVLVNIPNSKIINKLKICRQAVESDFIISVPVMKTHMHTQVSLGLKNMKGCLYKKEKVKLHQLPFSSKIKAPAKPLDMAIADMARVLMPDLTVIDGTIGLEGLGPSAGRSKKLNIIVASLDCLEADCTAARLMGFDPKKIQHLKLTSENLNSNTIKVDPPDYIKWKNPFQPPPKKISFEFSNVIIDDKDSCSACLSTVMMFLKRYYSEYADYFTKDMPLRIALGKSLGKQLKNTLLIGNCTIKQKNNGIYIKGCPPVASQIRKEVKKILRTGR